MTAFHMGQTCADCCCPHPDVCWRAEKCLPPEDERMTLYERDMLVTRLLLIAAVLIAYLLL